MTSMRAAMGVKKRYASLVAALQADGTLVAMQVRLLGLAEERGMMRWEYGAIDGAFPPGKGSSAGVARGGKGSLIHTLTDGGGMPLANRTTPANGDERA
jgi:hypothetical protein